MPRYASWLKVSPKARVTTAVAASSTVIQAGLDSRLVTGGVISAAQA
jgi:hypothetical protein